MIPESWWHIHWHVPGAHCTEDFDGCGDGPCTAGTNCTDLTPQEEADQGTAFNCSQCPPGYEYSDGVCVGGCHRATDVTTEISN